jgi:hypothetical protein
VSTANCTAEWIGSGVIGVSAALLVAAAAGLGSRHAHDRADQALAAYRAERERLKAPPAPAPLPFDIPPLPANPPLPAQDQTLQLHEVQAYRARHRKGHPACS